LIKPIPTQPGSAGFFNGDPRQVAGSTQDLRRSAAAQPEAPALIQGKRQSLNKIKGYSRFLPEGSVRREATGHYEVTSTAGGSVRAFVPAPLPPEPPLVLAGSLQALHEQALLVFFLWRS
jgi:hypothetical protein